MLLQIQQHHKVYVLNVLTYSLLKNFFKSINELYSDLEGRKEMFYLTTHSTHFIYGYMASDIW